MKIELDMYQTLAVAVLVLMLGKFLRARVQVLERFCIPAPVIGGVLFAIFTCVCYVTGVAEFAFDDILKEVHGARWLSMLMITPPWVTQAASVTSMRIIYSNSFIKLSAQRAWNWSVGSAPSGT